MPKPASVISSASSTGAATCSALVNTWTKAVFAPATSGPSAGKSESGTISYVRARPWMTHESPPIPMKISTATIE